MAARAVVTVESAHFGLARVALLSVDLRGVTVSGAPASLADCAARVDFDPRALLFLSARGVDGCPVETSCRAAANRQGSLLVAARLGGGTADGVVPVARLLFLRRRLSGAFGIAVRLRGATSVSAAGDLPEDLPCEVG